MIGTWYGNYGQHLQTLVRGAMRETSVQMMVSLGVHSGLWRVISIALKKGHEQREWDKILTKTPTWSSVRYHVNAWV